MDDLVPPPRRWRRPLLRSPSASDRPAVRSRKPRVAGLAPPAASKPAPARDRDGDDRARQDPDGKSASLEGMESRTCDRYRRRKAPRRHPPGRVCHLSSKRSHPRGQPRETSPIDPAKRATATRRSATGRSPEHQDRSIATGLPPERKSPSNDKK